MLGAGGQLGRALLAALPGAVGLTRAELDLADPAAVEAYDWSAHDLVLDAAGFTAVDAAETPEGRATCWTLDAALPARLARLSREQRFRLVHYSSDYVDDGRTRVHHEDEPLAPLGVYVARAVFARFGRDPGDVEAVSSAEYAAGRRTAPRPAHSTLDLFHLEATGWRPTDQLERLARHLAGTP